MFRLCLVALAWVSIVAAQTVGTRDESAQAAWKQAVLLHQAGDLAGAIEAYRACLKADPNRFDARSNLGAALSGLGRYPEAIAQYRLAIASAPPEFAARLRQNLGLAFYKSGQYGEAVAALAKVRQEQGPDLKNDLLLADSYLQNGEPGKAADLLSPYEATNPGDKGVAYVLGTALIRSGQVEHGQRVIDIILRDGDSAEGRFLMGAALFEAKDFPGAVKQFANALALNAEVPGLHSFYGQALLNTGDPDAAVKAFREELARNPNEFDSNLQLGDILLQRKAFGEALPLLRKAAAERSQSFAAQMALARVEVAERDYDHAIPLLHEIVSRWPESAAAHAELATADARSGHSAEAKAEQGIAVRLQGTMKQPDDDGPKLGNIAPEFVLPTLQSASSIAATASLKQMRSGGKPVVLLFGSYTCPNFRQQASAINALAEKYGSQAPFLLVYIREAHAGDNWQSTINQREGIDWQPATTMPAMQQHATACVRKLRMSFPAVVDGIDGKVEAAYAAWPSRLYVIGKSGRVVYRTRLSELDFRSVDVEAAIRKALAE